MTISLAPGIIGNILKERFGALTAGLTEVTQFGAVPVDNFLVEIPISPDKVLARI